jgi:hypothetical protein
VAHRSLERKNGWQLAEAAGDVSPAAMQVACLTI